MDKKKTTARTIDMKKELRKRIRACDRDITPVVSGR
jgi:hypothetical protein